MCIILQRERGKRFFLQIVQQQLVTYFTLRTVLVFLRKAVQSKQRRKTGDGLFVYGGDVVYKYQLQIISE